MSGRGRTPSESTNSESTKLAFIVPVEMVTDRSRLPPGMNVTALLKQAFDPSIEVSFELRLHSVHWLLPRPQPLTWNFVATATHPALTGRWSFNDLSPSGKSPTETQFRMNVLVRYHLRLLTQSHGIPWKPVTASDLIQLTNADITTSSAIRL